MKIEYSGKSDDRTTLRDLRPGDVFNGSSGDAWIVTDNRSGPIDRVMVCRLGDGLTIFIDGSTNVTRLTAKVVIDGIDPGRANVSEEEKTSWKPGYLNSSGLADL